MNISEFQALRNYIAMRDEAHFDMNWFLYYRDEEDDFKFERETISVKEALDCGTVGCIAGDYALMRGKTINMMGDTVDGISVPEFATLGLELDEQQANYLFYGKWTDHSAKEITKKETLDYLDRCIEAKELL